MPTVVSPNLDAVYTKLRAFLLTIVATGTEVVKGLGNRVPPPPGPYVAMTLIVQQRLATNQDTYADPTPTTGTRAVEGKYRLDMQLDFYGPNAGDWAAMSSTLLRDDYGCSALAPDCQPLFDDGGRQAPLVTGEEQYLQRWTLGAVLQYNPVTTLPQQFADEAVVGIINVDERYPP